MMTKLKHKVNNWFGMRREAQLIAQMTPEEQKAYFAKIREKTRKQILSLLPLMIAVSVLSQIMPLIEPFEYSRRTFAQKIRENIACWLRNVSDKILMETEEDD